MIYVQGAGEHHLQVTPPPHPDQLDAAWWRSLAELPSWDAGKLAVPDFYLLANGGVGNPPFLLYPDAQQALDRYLDEREKAHASRLSSVDLTGLVKTALRPHQEESVRFLFYKKRGGDFDEVGLGKTLTALAWYALLRREYGVKRALVFCENNVKRVWRGQTAIHYPGKVAVLGNGTETVLEDLEKAQDAGAEIIVTHYDALQNRKSRDIIDAFMDLDAQVLIADEAHSVRHPESLRTKRFLQLVYRRQYPYILFLTASPCSEQPSGSWTFLVCTAPERIRGPERFQNFFTQTYLVPVVVKKGAKGAHLEEDGRWVRRVKKVTGYRNLDHLRELLSDLSIRHKASDVTGMPPVVYEVEDVDLPPTHTHIYEELKEGVYEALVEKGGEMKALNLDLAGSRLLRLRQFLSWPESIGVPLPPPKAKVLDGILEEVLDDPKAKVVIWSSFKPAVEGLVQRYAEDYGALPYYGELTKNQRDDVLDAFSKREKNRILVCTYDTASRGLNDLQCARVAICLDRPLKHLQAEQADGRIRRLDSVGTATIIDLVVPDSVDEWVLDLIRRKHEMQSAVMDGTSATVDDLSVDDAKRLLPYIKPKRK